MSFVAKKRFYPDILEKWKKDGVLFEESKSFPGVIKEKTWEVVIEYFNHSLIKTLFENDSLGLSILLIANELDTFIPPEYVKIFYDALSCDKKFVVIPDSPHTPKEKIHLDNLSNIIDTWLKEQLKKSE